MEFPTSPICPAIKLLELCRPLHPIEFKDLFCLSDQRVHTLSVGASSSQDLELHLHAVSLLETTHGLLPIIINRLKFSVIKTMKAGHIIFRTFWAITWAIVRGASWNYKHSQPKHKWVQDDLF